MIDHAVILAPRDLAARIVDRIGRLRPDIRCAAVETVEELETASRKLAKRALLLSQGTSVIVPAEILELFGGRAVNIHAASPEYPGRDPHHFAVYDRAVRYGATAHRMVAAVDAGEILAVRYFDVTHPASPRQLLERANACACGLVDEILPDLLDGRLEPLPGATWGNRKTSRRDLEQLCSIAPYIGREEFERRRTAGEWGRLSNIHLDLHGWRFRLEGPVANQDLERASEKWGDFTEANYRRLLGLAKKRYRFASFEDPGGGVHVLWRHDVDFSVHRALRLAEIEAEEGVQATYFFMLRSQFYSLDEPEIVSRIERIRDLGHRIGLHFQVADDWPGASSGEEIECLIARDRDRLAELIEAPLEAVSFHNPEATGLLSIDAPRLAGLANAYGRPFHEHYGYCSDSNGYWRFDPLEDVLVNGGHDRLQVLTHPVWWTPRPMSPHARVERCVLGRAAAHIHSYDKTLEAQGRRNISY